MKMNMMKMKMRMKITDLKNKRSIKNFYVRRNFKIKKRTFTFIWK